MSQSNRQPKSRRPTEHTREEKRTKKAINVRTILVTILGAAIVLPSLVLLRRYQVSRTADRFLDRAAELKQEGEWRSAAEYVDRYRRLRTDDEQAVIDVARTYDQSASSPAAKDRAAQLYYQAIGTAAASDDSSTRLKLPELRLRLAEILLEVGQTDSTKLAEAEKLAASVVVTDCNAEQVARSWRVLALTRLAMAHAGEEYAALNVDSVQQGTVGALARNLSLVDLVEKSHSLQPDNAELTFALATGIYGGVSKFREKLGPEISNISTEQARDRASAVIDAFVEARSLRLKDLLTAFGEPAENKANDDGQFRQLAAVYQNVVQHLKSTSSTNLERRSGKIGKLLLDEIRQNDGLLRQVELNDELAAQLHDHDTGILDEDMTASLCIEIEKSFARQNPELLATIVVKSLDREKERYLEALLGRAEYRLLNNIEGADADLNSAFEWNASDLRALLLAARNAESEAGRKKGPDSKENALTFSRVARKYYEKAIDVAPRDDRAYSGLGELYLAFPAAATNDGNGRIREVGGQGLVQPGKGLRCHFDGLNNDMIISAGNGLAKACEVVIVNEHAEGDQALVSFDRRSSRFRIDVDPDHTTAKTVVDEINRDATLGSVLDNSLDYAIATWQDGIRAASSDTPLLRMRLAEVLISFGYADKAQEILGSVDKSIEQMVAQGDINGLDYLKRQRDILKACSLLFKGKTVESLTLLQAIQAEAKMSADTPTQKRVWHLLSQAYSVAARWSDAARAFEELTAFEEGEHTYHQQAGLCWVKAGIFDRAIAQYEKAAVSSDDPEILFALARTEFERQRTLPKEVQKWQNVEQLLTSLVASANFADFENPWRAGLLKVEALLERTDDDADVESESRNMQFVDELQSIEDRYRDSFPLCMRLSYLYERLDRPKDTERVLKHARTLATPNGPAIAELALRLSAIAEERGDLDQSRGVLESAMGSVATTDQPSIRAALTRVDLLSGDGGRAKDRLKKCYEKDPGDPAVLLGLAELALDAKDHEEVQRWIGELRQVEGKDGPNTRLLSARLKLSEIEGLDDTRAEEAEQTLLDLAKESPHWFAPHWLLAQIYEARGNIALSEKHLREVLLHGEGFVGLYEKLIAALCAQQKFDEAADMLAEARMNGHTSTKLNTLSLTILAGRGEIEPALTAIMQTIRADQGNAQAWAQAGTLLAMSDRENKFAKAEFAFKKALELQPANIALHMLLIKFYAASSQKESAREAIGLMTNTADVSQLQLDLALAESSELIGDRLQAIAHYRKALDTAPTQHEVSLRLAHLIRDTDPKEAEHIARELLRHKPFYEPAQRFLAMLMAGNGNENDWSEVDNLLEAPDGEKMSHENALLKARLLVQRGGASRRQEARALLEQVAATDRGLTDDDQLLLCRLYDAEGKVEDARQSLIGLAEKPHPRSADLVALIKLLIRQRSYEEASRWVDRLEETAPDSWQSLEMKVLLLHVRNQDAMIVPLVNDFYEISKEKGLSANQIGKVQQSLGDLYSSIGIQSQAEEWYRRHFQSDRSAFEKLAICLSLQQRVDEAAELCIDAWEKEHSAKAAIALAGVLQTGRGTQEHLRKAEPYLLEALKLHPDHVELMLMIANMRLVFNDNAAAATLYRRILKLDPENLLAMNNLASLLSESSSTQSESLQLIDTAISIAGRQGVSPNVEALLADTKGAVLLYLGRPQEALPLLEQAVSIGSGEAVYHLHLAAAYNLVGNTEEALNKVDSAQELGVNRLLLGSLDRKHLEELLKLEKQQGS